MDMANFYKLNQNLCVSDVTNGKKKCKLKSLSMIERFARRLDTSLDTAMNSF